MYVPLKKRMGLGPGTQHYQEIKNPESLCRAYHLVSEYLSLFQVQ